MATKFLDKTGLSHFWSKIKAWCNATFATITHSHAWSTITGKPTTISGYGITDAKIANGTITLGSNSITPLTSHQTLPTLSRTISGSGNAITDITVSGHAITATKGATFLTSHQTLPTLSLTTSGSGNAITALSVSDHAITATKGASYITSSGSITGNAATATTATKLGTSTVGSSVQPIYLNAGTATAVSSALKSCYAVVESEAVTNNIFKIASGSMGSAYNSLNLVILIQNIMGANAAIWRISLNAGSTAGVYSVGTSVLVDNIGLDPANFIVAYKSNSGGNLNFELYTKIAARYAGYRFTVIQEIWRSNQKLGNILTLYNQLTTTGTAAITSGYTALTTSKASVNMDISGNAATVTGTAGTSLLAWNTENTVYTVGGHAIKVKLPANPNTDTHWTSHLYAGASNGNANAATTNGNTYLIICDNSTARDRRLIKGTGATTVTSDANGVITIHSTDSNTVYTHPTTSGNKHIPSGGSSGQILRWSADGTAAWGADNNTTYSAATQSAAGLMSAADKKKLDGIAAGADSIPVGTIIYYTHKTVPANFLICNGGAVSRTTYATLFKLIGTTYGKGNGSSTFNVPNLIGRFPEGNATPGTVHNAGLPNITGEIHYHVYSNSASGAFYDNGGVYRDGSTDNNHAGTAGGSKGFSAARSSSIYGASSTVQPPALTLVPCIRYA